MKLLACVVILAVVSIPVLGQTRDRNLVRPRIRSDVSTTRIRTDVSTVRPPHIASNGKQTNEQLDRLERQTARSLTPPPKKNTTPLPKLKADAPPRPNASQEPIPPHAKINNAPRSGSSVRSGPGGKAKPYPH